jgi:aspartate kinase
MLVLKFGGASTHTAEGIRTVSSIVQREQVHGVLVVVSAIGKTTRAIDSAALRASGGDAAGAVVIIDDIIAQHRSLATEVYGEGAPGERVKQALEREEERLRALVKGISIVKELSARSRDACLAQGERLAAALLVESFGTDRSAYVPAFELMPCDASYGCAHPDLTRLREHSAHLLAPLVAPGHVAVTEGYIGAAPDGSPTTMGLESSDYSAALLGAVLRAHEVQIWTNVDGMMTADPRLFPEARTIARLSYDEAEDLAALGAKVLHPRTIEPLRKLSIPLVIRNAQRPDGNGTHITADGSASGRGMPKGVAALEGLDEVVGSDGVRGVIGATAGRATRTWSPREGAPFGAVSIVGEGVGLRGDLVPVFTEAVGPANILGLIFGASPNAITAIVTSTHVRAAVAAVHELVVGGR